MDTSPPTPGALTQGPPPIDEFWRHYLASADAATAELLGQSPDPASPEALRRRWLAAASECSDRFLRSPAFLQAMRQYLAALVGLGSAPVSASPAPAASGPPARAATELLEALDRWSASCQQLVRESLFECRKALDLEAAPPGSARTATPVETVHAEGTMRLLHFQHTRPPRYAEPVVFCCSLVNRPTIVDLQPRRSVVRHLLDAGFDVYLIDWGVPAPDDCRLDLNDYQHRLLPAAVGAAQRRAAQSPVTLVGYCMGGTLAAMFAAVEPHRVKNLVLMAAPIDFHVDESLLALWARPEHFDVDAIVTAFGNCPGALLQSCFQLMRPVQNFAEKYYRLCQRRDDLAFLENFLAMEQWASDSVPIAGEAFRQFVQWFYQENRLVRGALTLGGRRVDLSAIACSLLLLTATADHLVPPASSLAILQHVGSRDVEAFSLDAGHIGLAVGSRAHEQLWPRAAAWLRQRSTATA